MLQEHEHNLKLNPTKFIFEAKGGKFFWNLITKRGIKANLAKMQTLCNISPRRILKEV